MIYIFLEGWDPVGEGMRANLLEFPDMESARIRLATLQADDNTTRTLLIQGETLESWDSEQKLSSDDLRTFAISGVDDLSNKENV